MSYIGKEPIVGNFQKCDAITTSSTATYNLTVGSVAVFPETTNNCIVSLNGVIQAPTSAYTISGSQIVFNSSLTSSDVVDFILILGSVLSVGTPTDNTVSTAKVADDAITLAKMASGTDGQIITYDASGNPTAVGPGSDGQVLTSTGAGSPPAFEAAVGGATTFISNTTISNDSTVEITSGINSTYDIYKIYLVGVTVSLDNGSQNFEFQYQIGGSFITANYRYAVHRNHSGSATGSGYVSQSASAIRINADVTGGASTEALDMLITLYTPSSTSKHKQITYQGVNFTANNQLENWSGCGINDNAGAVTGFRVQPSAGTFPAGNIYLYGVNKS
tara:strand:- start:1159 stop:2157 length:999 start_codon:yes stop_codon:yes gene_type:complete